MWLLLAQPVTKELSNLTSVFCSIIHLYIYDMSSINNIYLSIDSFTTEAAYSGIFSLHGKSWNDSWALSNT